MPAVDVDLSRAELAGKIRSRFAELCAIAEHQTLGRGNLASEIALDLDEMARVTEAYFLLNEAYKVARPAQSAEETSRSIGPQKVALSALAVFAFEPFRQVRPNQPLLSAPSDLVPLHFVLDFAKTVLQDAAFELTHDMQMRLFRFLDHQVMHALGQYQQDQVVGIFKLRYAIEIDLDLHVVDMLILLFELHSRPGQGEEED